VPAPTPIAITPKPLEITPEFKKTLDRCGYLQARYAAEKHWIDELTRVEKTIQEYCKDCPAEQPVHLEGKDYTVDLGIREYQQKITDKPKAFALLKKAMGLGALIEALSFTLKLLDAHVPKEKQTFVTKARTGPRDLSSALKIVDQAA
jgi:hypothetical protein